MREICRAIARVEKTHGRKGEVVTVPVHGLPLVMREGMRVAIVPPALKGDRWHEVLSCETSASGQLVALSGVTTIDAAQELVGKTVLALSDELPADFDLHDAESLWGREVVDASLGFIGTVTEVMFGPANDVWVVEGPFGEVLLPVIPSVVTEVPAEGPISVTAPAGSIGEVE